MHFNESEDTQTFTLLFQTAFLIPTDQVWSRPVPPVVIANEGDHVDGSEFPEAVYMPNIRLFVTSCLYIYIYTYINCSAGFLKHQLYVGSLQRITFLQLSKFTVGEGEGVGG